ncbi:MAG: hypothetical protein ACOYYS_15765 [Chloroflexota bacterium]
MFEGWGLKRQTLLQRHFGTPLVVYDEDDFVFLNHPNPPTQRPEQLSAATATEINGVLTATIPAMYGDDENILVPLAYYECFHVYQKTAFRLRRKYDFFEVLAFYPELNVVYRALCSAETEVISHSRLSPVERAAYLSALTYKRHEILSQHEGLLDFEQDLEVREGVAAFVESKALWPWPWLMRTGGSMNCYTMEYSSSNSLGKCFGRSARKVSSPWGMAGCSIPMV